MINNIINSTFIVSSDTLCVYRYGSCYLKGQSDTVKLSPLVFETMRHSSAVISMGVALQMALHKSPLLTISDALSSEYLSEVALLIKIDYVVISAYEFTGYSLERFFQKGMFPLCQEVSEKYLDNSEIMVANISCGLVSGRIMQLVYEKYSVINSIDFRSDHSLISFYKEMMGLFDAGNYISYLDSVIGIRKVTIKQNKKICVEFRHNCYEGFADSRR